MIYEEFLTLKGKDFKGRTLGDIWSFSDKEIEELNRLDESEFRKILKFFN